MWRTASPDPEGIAHRDHSKRRSEQFVKDVPIGTTTVSSVTGVARVAGVTWIAGIADISKVAKVPVYHLVFKQFSDVLSAEAMDMATAKLANCGPIEGVDVASANEAHGLPRGRVDVLSHMGRLGAPSDTKVPIGATTGTRQPSGSADQLPR